MIAAIYVRKSKNTQKGESIENQTNRAIAYCKEKGWEYKVYEDYGISGKNLNRPGFQAMMVDINAHKIGALVCYKLDRVSRSVKDFATLIDTLTNLNVSFVSLNEQFDTSTPMGKTIMMILSVFAEFERNSIAERVKDNMYDRAKMGKWNGGKVVFGYDIVREQINLGERVINNSKLSINDEQAEIVKLIFDHYLKFKCKRKLLEYLNSNNIKPSNSESFTKRIIDKLLTNMIYCKADKDILEYIEENNMDLNSPAESFDGSNGVMTYNLKKGSKKLPMNEWIIAIGEHQGIIDGKTFIEVQSLIKENSFNSFARLGTGHKNPLVHLIKCECGSGVKAVESRGYNYLRCVKRDMKENVKCNVIGVRYDRVEIEVFKAITKLFNNDDMIRKAIDEYNKSNMESYDTNIQEMKAIKNRIKKIDENLNSLVDALIEKTLPEDVLKVRCNKLENERKKLNNKLSTLQEATSVIDNQELDVNTIKEIISSIDVSSIFDVDADLRKQLYNSVIDKIIMCEGKICKVYFTLPFSKEVLSNGNHSNCKGTRLTNIPFLTEEIKL